MASSSNTTLASLWVDDGQGSPVKMIPSTSKSHNNNNNGTELKDEFMRYYKDNGLDSMAKEAGVIDSNGELPGFKDQQSITSKTAIQLVALPITGSPSKLSPSSFKFEQKQIYSNTAVNSHQMNISQVLSSSRQPIVPMESRWSTRKRVSEITVEPDFSEGKRSKKGEKGGKGLRHFSMKVCEKVQKKGVTTYNEVADELVAEFSNPRNISLSDQAYDQKNIRRRVYDALNVLMAMNIISKEKKEIRWIGLPTNSAQECQNLEQIAFKNLVERNRHLENTQGRPPQHTSIQLPFIIVNTSKKTVIDCSISNDKCEYLFSFDNTFEIHDDIEVLKRMGMAFGLERGQCLPQDLERAVKMVPKALVPYVQELSTASSSGALSAGPSGIRPVGSAAVDTSYLCSKTLTPSSPLATPLSDNKGDSTDAEVAIATNQDISRQTGFGSRDALETPSEQFSDDCDSYGSSSPLEIN